jgi:CubicO group peptidase (beta-lactamase class C family)
VLAVGLAGGASSLPASAAPTATASSGAEPWVPVPTASLAKECKLDPALLAKADKTLGNTNYAIYRYGKLCKAGGPAKQLHEPYAVNSSTKTFGALLFGLVAGRLGIDETTLFRDALPPTYYANDPGSLALAGPPPNPNARIFEALTSTGQNPAPAYGTRIPWNYETLGNRGMNGLVKLMDEQIRAHPDKFPGSKSARDVAYKEIFAPLGMKETFWDGSIIAGGMTSTVYDMGKLGELLLRQGRWGNRQLVDADYVYRMSHPQIEDVHTAYGYLTWVNSAAGVAPPYDENMDDECSPFSSWPKYPHPPTNDAPSSNGGAPFTNKYDIGTFWFDGAGGQYTYVHRGLDLVLVIRDDELAQDNDPEAQQRGASNVSGLEYHRIWRLVRPAIVALDPTFKGNEAAFCKAYREGQYAPDLRSPWLRGSGYGSIHDVWLPAAKPAASVPAKSGGSGGVASAGTSTAKAGTGALAATGLSEGGALLGVMCASVGAGAWSLRRRLQRA